jgi:predicted dehydrogenase
VVQIDTQNKIKNVLIVGLGSIGRRHLRLIRDQIPNARIFSLRHSEEKLSEEIPGIEKSFFKIEDAILEKPDIAIIANPAPFHISTAKKLAKAGIHLLVEKPISHNLEGVEDLIEACRLKNIKLMTGFNLRFLSCLNFFKSTIESNILGTVLSIRAEIGQNLESWRPGSDYSKGVSANHELGGGVLLELSHEIDYLSWIFGEPNWVMASLSTQSNLKIDVEDSAHILMGLEAKAFNGTPISVSLNLDFIRHDHTRNCYAIGEKGTIKCNLLSNSVHIKEKNKDGWTEIFNEPSERDITFSKQIKNFIQSIENGELLKATGEDGLKSLKVIDAIRISDKKERKVVISK